MYAGVECVITARQVQPAEPEPNSITTSNLHHQKMAAPVSLDRIPPTTTAYVIATAIVAGVTGYFIGQGASLNLFKEKQGWPNGYDVKVHRDSSDEEDESEEEESEEEGNGEELVDFKDNVEEVKLVLAVRTDLGMTKGMSTYVHC